MHFRKSVSTWALRAVIYLNFYVLRYTMRNTGILLLFIFRRTLRQILLFSEKEL